MTPISGTKPTVVRGTMGTLGSTPNTTPSASASAPTSRESAGVPREGGRGATGSSGPLAGPKRRYAASPAEKTNSGAATAHANVTPEPSSRVRSEEHTSELQSRQYLVCRLLLEKKNTHDNCDVQTA